MITYILSFFELLMCDFKHYLCEAMFLYLLINATLFKILMQSSIVTFYHSLSRVIIMIDDGSKFKYITVSFEDTTTQVMTQYFIC